MADQLESAPAPTLINDGKGFGSDKQAGKFFEESGLGEAVLASEDSSASRRATTPGEGIDEWELQQREATGAVPPIQEVEGGAYQATPGAASSATAPSDQATAPPPIPEVQRQAAQHAQALQQQAVEQEAQRRGITPEQLQREAAYHQRAAQDPEFAYSEMEKAKVQVQAELQSIAANRAALVTQHGLSAVVSRETELRGYGQQVENGQRELAQSYQVAQRQARARHEQQMNADRATLAKQLNLSPKEFVDVATETADSIAAAGGDPGSLLDPRQVKFFMEATLARRKAKEAVATRDKAIRAAARKVRQARREPESRLDKLGMVKLRNGGTARPGSVEAAADQFDRMGIV